MSLAKDFVVCDFNWVSHELERWVLKVSFVGPLFLYFPDKAHGLHVIMLL